ncbi:MAG: methyltransferase domain-containing protein [Arachnia sp.]
MGTWKPNSYPSLSPYLICQNAEGLIAFIEAAFGGTLQRRFDRPDGSLMHAEVRIDDSILMIGGGATTARSGPVHLHLYVPDARAAFDRAIGAGAIPVSGPAQKTDDDDLRGGVQDPWGNTWWLATQPDDAAHHHTEIAQSFGADAQKYDRARPRYPADAVDAVVSRLPGRSILDVGIGTGISSEPFRDRGLTVLGVEPDPKMAEVAREKGFVVETARFEEWDPAGRLFDGVIAGQAWHWVDPVAGAAKAAEALRPGGRIALLWNAATAAPEIAAEFAAGFAALDTGLPFNPWAARPGADPYGSIIDRAAAALLDTGSFAAAERLTFAWRTTVERDAWLEQTSTSGGINSLPPQKLDALLRMMGRVIDAAGGSLTVNYETVVAIAERLPR